jgi:hypothetical protein
MFSSGGIAMTATATGVSNEPETVARGHYVKQPKGASKWPRGIKLPSDGGHVQSGTGEALHVPAL